MVGHGFFTLMPVTPDLNSKPKSDTQKLCISWFSSSALFQICCPISRSPMTQSLHHRRVAGEHLSISIPSPSEGGRVLEGPTYKRITMNFPVASILPSSFAIITGLSDLPLCLHIYHPSGYAFTSMCWMSTVGSKFTAGKDLWGDVCHYTRQSPEKEEWHSRIKGQLEWRVPGQP